jgi:formate dehydrogenase iron-sulfur subunit
MINRRAFLKLGGAGLGAALLAPTGAGQAAAPKSAAADKAASMLYDGGKCVGCRACQSACKARAGLPVEPDATGLYEAPQDLSASTWTLIKLYQDQSKHAFVKRQCMHCIEPACVSVCPVGALEKLESGPVVYHAERCIGCRYCMAACPFEVPKSQWDKNLPLIQKCDFCADRQAAGQEPVCSQVCPTGALIYGNRKQMLDTANTRINSNASYSRQIYGEDEAGGTSMLYISPVDFKSLGFPSLDARALPAITWPYMMAVPGIVVVMVGLSTAIYLRTHHRLNSAIRKEA